MRRRLRIRVDYTRCVGSTICTLTTPRVFALNKDRQSEVRDPVGESPERVLEAAEACPQSAIIVEDAETGQRLFP